jgi:hypothetical protein
LEAHASPAAQSVSSAMRKSKILPQICLVVLAGGVHASAHRPSSHRPGCNFRRSPTPRLGQIDPTQQQRKLLLSQHDLPVRLARLRVHSPGCEAVGLCRA